MGELTSSLAHVEAEAAVRKQAESPKVVPRPRPLLQLSIILFVFHSMLLVYMYKCICFYVSYLSSLFSRELHVQRLSSSRLAAPDASADAEHVEQIASLRAELRALCDERDMLSGQRTSSDKRADRLQARLDTVVSCMTSLYLCGRVLTSSCVCRRSGSCRRHVPRSSSSAPRSRRTWPASSSTSRSWKNSPLLRSSTTTPPCLMLPRPPAAVCFCVSVASSFLPGSRVAHRAESQLRAARKEVAALHIDLEHAQSSARRAMTRASEDSSSQQKSAQYAARPKYMTNDVMCVF